MLSFTVLLSLVLCKVVKQGGFKVGGVGRCQRALCDITSRSFFRTLCVSARVCMCVCFAAPSLRRAEQAEEVDDETQREVSVIFVQ